MSMWTLSANNRFPGWMRPAILLGVLASGAAHSADDGIARLLQAYPRHLCDAEANSVVWCDGTKMPYAENGGEKTHRQKLQRADLRDQMEQRYPAGTNYPAPPPPDFEPGRIRNEAFFKKMYGASPDAVRKRLAPVAWLPKSGGKRVWITTVNRVNERLQAISDELDRLPAELKRYVDQPAGTFNWRVIAEEQRLSPHSFGIAIDINAATGDYWLWRASSGRSTGYRNRIPMKIVEIFEKHGFIWGGKWHRYDTLHFEYRPELLPLPGNRG